MKKILTHLHSEWYKYVLEILVITVGILGAFALNNWNENRKQLAAEKVFLSNVFDDLGTDSIQFDYYIQQYQKIENLHVQLYQIGIKNEVLDNSIEPIYIRRALYFKQLIGQDFMDKGNPIINNQVREELIDYTKKMADFEMAHTSQLMGVINDQLKPYLTAQKVYNTDKWFEMKSKVFEDYAFDELDGQNIVDNDKLVELSKTKEFQQILFELNLKWNEFHSRLLSIMQANSKLRSVIKEELTEQK